MKRLEGLAETRGNETRREVWRRRERMFCVLTERAL